MELYHQTLSLALSTPITTTDSNKIEKVDSLLLILQLGKWEGYGSVTAPVGNTTLLPSITETIEEKQSMIAKFALTDPERYWHYLHHLIPEQPFLIAALDMAAWDLFGKMQQMPVYELMNLSWQNIPINVPSFNVSEQDEIINQIKDREEANYSLIGNWTDLMDTLKELSNKQSTSYWLECTSPINCTEIDWQELQAFHITKILIDTRTEGLEDIIQQGKMVGIIIVLKDFKNEDELEKMASTSIEEITIDSMLCSGITPAKKLILAAKAKGIKSILTSNLGTILEQASASLLLPMVDASCIHFPTMLKQDIGVGLTLDNGQINVSNKFGLGIQLK